MKIIANIIAGIIAGILALSCLVPSLSVNISAHLLRGEPWHSGAIYVVTVLMAAVVMIARPIALRYNEKQVAMVCLILAVVALTFNTKNAVVSSTISRAAFSDPRKAEIAMITSLEAEQNILANIIAKSPARSSDIIGGEIATFLLDPAAGDCGGAWNGPVTKRVCPDVIRLRAEKSTALDYERKQARLAEVRDELNKLKARPSMADPNVENIGLLLSFVMTVNEGTHKWIGLGDDLHVALCVELLAMLGPSVCWFLFAAFALHGRQERRRTDTPGLPDTIATAMIAEIGQPKAMITAMIDPPITEENQSREDTAPAIIAEAAAADGPTEGQRGASRQRNGRTVTIPTCVQAFFDSHVIKQASGKVGATELYEAYVAASTAPVSQALFGRAATATFKKKMGREISYVGITVRGARPALRSVK